MPERPEPEERTEDRPSVRGRLRSALGRPSRAQLVVSLLLASVGFAVITQVQSTQLDNSYAGYREQDLIEVLSGLSASSQKAQQELERLERTRRELRSSSNARQAAIEQAREKAEALAILSGTVPVTGPGLRITIEEVEGRVEVGTLLDTIQELRTGGAEAMEFNDQVRVVAQTAIEDAVGGVYVGDTFLSPPYVIDVIGEPHTLAGSLTFVGGPIETAREEGVLMTYEELDQVDIKSTHEPTRPDFAQPQREQ